MIKLSRLILVIIDASNISSDCRKNQEGLCFLNELFYCVLFVYVEVVQLLKCNS